MYVQGCMEKVWDENIDGALFRTIVGGYSDCRTQITGCRLYERCSIKFSKKKSEFQLGVYYS